MKVKNIYKKVLSVLAVFVLFIGILFGNVKTITTKAEYNSISTDSNTTVEDLYDGVWDYYDKSDVMQDLLKLNINTSLYSGLKGTKIVEFMEYCYSENDFFIDKFGLYLYVYSDNAPFRDSCYLNIAVEYDSSEKPIIYQNVSLKYIDSNDNFHKFKVNDNYYFSLSKIRERQQAYNHRRYDIAGFQHGSVIDKGIGKTYIFTGYMGECENPLDDRSSLHCKVETLDTISLDVRPTVWRPEGNDGTNEYTQDSLHSVYFAIPNRYLDNYGSLYGVHAQWLSALLKPMLCIGDETIFNLVKNYAGESDWSSLNICFAINLEKYIGGQGNNSYSKDYSLNFPKELASFPVFADTGSYFNNFSVPYMVFPTDKFEEDRADNYAVPSSSILQQMIEYTKTSDGNLVNNKYSEALFASVDSEWTNKTIYADESYTDLRNFKLDENFWNRLWGDDYVEHKTYDIDAIKRVGTLSGNQLDDCADYYINPSDYNDFKVYCEAAKKDDCTVYLFRYRTSKYVSAESEVYIKSESWLLGETADCLNSNAYFFQEYVDLDFEIIDLTFKDSNDNLTVLPVVSTPVDNVGGSTPPIDTESDDSMAGFNTWLENTKKDIESFFNDIGKGINGFFSSFGGVLLLLVLLAIFAPLLPAIVSLFVTIIKAIGNVLIWLFKGIWWVLCFPFNLIIKLFEKKDKK